MSKNMIIAIVVALAAAGGIGGYLVTQNNDDDSSTTNTSNTAQQGSDQTDQNSTPINNSEGTLPQLLPQQSFIATGTFTDTNENGTSGSFTMNVVDQNTYSMVFTSAGQSGEVVVADGYSYVGADGQTIRFPLDQAGGQTGLSLSDVSLSDEDYADFRDHANYLGKMSCNAGQCDVWEATNQGDLTSGRIYLANDVIVKLSATNADGSSFDLEYDFNQAPIVNVPETYTDFAEEFGNFGIPQ